MENKNHIKSLQIKNFKSIKSAKLDCKRINIFIGRPNSGKSNLLEALSLFSTPYVEKGTKNKFGEKMIRYETINNLFYDLNMNSPIEIITSIGYATLRWHKGLDFYDLVLSSYKTILKSAELTSTYNKYKTQLKTHFDDPTQNEKAVKPYILSFDNAGNYTDNDFNLSYKSPVKRYDFNNLYSIQFDNTFYDFLLPNGKNLFAIVQTNPEIQKLIGDFFKEYKLEFLLDFASKKFEIQKRKKNVAHKIPFDLTADTFKRIIYNLTAILSNKDSVILFEEPENHSFPPYIQLLCDYIKESESNQFFITTHSPYLINSFIEDLKIWGNLNVYHTYYENYQTKVKLLNADEIDTIWGSATDVFFNLKHFK